MSARRQVDHQSLGDLELAACISARDPLAVRLVTQRNNQRLFRAAWSILRNRPEAEDAVQAAYLKAFAAIDTFQGGAALTTWLTRIVINEALERRRADRRRQARLDAGSVVALDEYREKLMLGSEAASPDGALARAQIRRLLEAAIGRLPEDFRLVFVLREIEGLSVEEASQALGVPPATIKTRFLRARRRLQAELDPELKTALEGTFPFAGVDCEALTDRVLAAFCAPRSKETLTMTDQNLDRRAALTLGATTLSAAGMLAVLGVAAPRGAVAAAAPAQDLALLNAAIALEHEGIAAYQLGAESGLLSPEVLKTAVTFQGHHKQHRDELAAAVRRLGGHPAVAKALSAYAADLGAGTLKDQAGVLRLALKLERGAANAYLGLIPSLGHADFHVLAARMAGDEAFHAAILGNALGEAIPQKALIFG